MPTIDELIEEARRVSQLAYAPYSQFYVGAVVVAGGQSYSACNVENASYGLSCCAERNAIFKMVADGQKQLECVVIFTPTDQPTAPCGACRQVLNEFGPTARLISACRGSQRIDSTIDQLFPQAFGPKNLS
jgi:cytidine deaminase